MFDFAFYRAHARMVAMEAAGLPSFLRDEHGEIMFLCNDGNVYCNITTFDWTQPHVRALWVEQVVNISQSGLVDGIFADHSSYIGITIGRNKRKHQGPNQLCNGVRGQERCYNFTDEFRDSFNSWHLWSANYTQDVLAKSGGAVFQGPYAEAEYRAAGDVCAFDDMQEFALHGKSESDVFIIQSPRARPHTMEACQPTEACLAAFLAAAKPYMYIYCQWDKGEDLIKETTFPEMDYVLGDPESDAVEVEPGVWRRRFGGGSKGITNMTVVFWDNNKKTGNISWAGHGHPPPPSPPSSPPLPPPGAVCNPATFLDNTAYADGTGIAEVKAASAVACCTKCAAAEATRGCFWFSFDQATGKCFLKADDRHPQERMGVTSGLTHHHSRLKSDDSVVHARTMTYWAGATNICGDPRSDPHGRPDTTCVACCAKNRTDPDRSYCCTARNSTPGSSDWEARLALLSAHRENLTGLIPCAHAIGPGGKIISSYSDTYSNFAPYYPRLKDMGLKLYAFLGNVGGQGSLQAAMNRRTDFFAECIAEAKKNGYE